MATRPGGADGAPAARCDHHDDEDQDVSTVSRRTTRARAALALPDHIARSTHLRDSRGTEEAPCNTPTRVPSSASTVSTPDGQHDGWSGMSLRENPRRTAPDRGLPARRSRSRPAQREHPPPA